MRVGDWDYTASIDTEDTIKRETSYTDMGPCLGNPKTLDNLAVELANLLDGRDLFLAKGDYEDPGVSLMGSQGSYILTQYGHLSDEELGLLGLLVQRYTEERVNKYDKR